MHAYHGSLGVRIISTASIGPTLGNLPRPSGMHSGSVSMMSIGRPTHGNLTRPSGMHSGSVPMMSIGRPTHGNLTRLSGMHSGCVPMMTTASTVRWTSRRRQA